MSVQNAFMFPGQGSQFVGMGQAVAAVYPEARAVYDEVDEALGFGLSDLCFTGDEDELRRTENTQPAILATSIAVYRALATHGIEASCMAGHSLGEYSALVAAGSLQLADAARVVRARGRFMQEAVPEGEGAMAAILGLEDAQVEDVCARAAAGDVVSAANYNSPGQVVIAGAAVAVERAVELAKEAGARRALLLNVSAPFHCALMEPAAVRLDEVLADIVISDPRCPVICNVDATAMTASHQVRPALRRQVTAPVRWVENVATMREVGATRLIEVGPGKVLTGLAKRAARGVPAAAVHSPEEIENFVAAS